MSVTVASAFKSVYAEWVYRRSHGMDVGSYAEDTADLWVAMTSIEQNIVKAEILTEPLVVETHFIVGPVKTWPLQILVVHWALPALPSYPQDVFMSSSVYSL